MQVNVKGEIGSLLDLPAVIRWFQTSPVPRWILAGVVVLGIGATLSRGSASGSRSGGGGIALLILLVFLLGAAYWIWRSI